MAVAFCLECGNTITLDARLHEGQQLICTECGARLEVINVIPLELDWVYAEPCHDPEEYWHIEHDLLSGVITDERDRSRI
jgi:lysine biosynthesis protein LysW